MERKGDTHLCVPPHQPGFKRKLLLKHERKQMEREVRAELEAKMGDKRMGFDEAMELLDRRLENMDMDGLTARYSPGWTKTEEGDWLPPGYGWIGLPEGGEGSGEPVSGPQTPRDSI